MLNGLENFLKNAFCNNLKTKRLQKARHPPTPYRHPPTPTDTHNNNNNSNNNDNREEETSSSSWGVTGGNYAPAPSAEASDDKKKTKKIPIKREQPELVQGLPSERNLREAKKISLGRDGDNFLKCLEGNYG